MVEADLLAQFTTIITPIVLIGGMLFGSVKYLQQQAEKKADRVKKQAEETAEDLKSLTESVARDVKEKVDKNKEDTMKSSEELKRLTIDIGDKAKMYSDDIYKTILGRIETVDKRVTEMLLGLSQRANLTNGNVASIRSDILDLQVDLQELYEEMQYGGSNNDEIDRRDQGIRRKVREKKQRSKRRKIDSDRINQSELALNPSSDQFQGAYGDSDTRLLKDRPSHASLDK